GSKATWRAVRGRNTAGSSAAAPSVVRTTTSEARVEGEVEAHGHGRDELRELLSHAPGLSALPADALDDLVAACEVLELPGGTCLVRAGEVLDALYGVVHGALRVVRRTHDGLEQPIRDFYRGETVGIMGLVVARASPLDLFVVRDSTIMRLARTALL